MALNPEALGQSRSDLAETLRDLRKRAGLSGDRLAKRCAMSQSKISKIETGRTIPTLVDVERILRALDAPQDLVREINALTRLANTQWQDVRSLRRTGLEKKQVELAALDSSSDEIRYFLLSMLTTLLATPEYVRASLAHVPGDQSRAIAKKLERQAVLYDRSKSFRFVLTELSVRWAVLPAPAMMVQTDHLISVSRLPHVRLGVIPIGTPAPDWPLNTFTLYDDRLATVETETGIMVLRDPRDVAHYHKLFDAYEKCALFDDDARAMLAQWSSHFHSDL